ncbi:MAG: iron ABC transporter permease [Bacillus wiedmannii]|nr:iron ABC transporter permease [Bacillus wiedmannii]
MEASASSIEQQEENVKEIKSRPLIASIILVAGTVLLALSMAVSISFGAADISLKTVWQAVFQFDGSITHHNVIQELRMPRAIGGVVAGAFLAVSGAIMQGMTRNPLASPSLMGITDGAVFGIAIMYAFFPNSPYLMFVIASFIGAAFGASIVYGIGSSSPGGLTPVKLALAGAAISALLGAISSGIALYFNLAQEVSMWNAGGVAGVKWESINMLVPIGLVCLFIAIMMSRYITILSFGEEIAIGLGQNTTLIKFIGTVLVLVLTGSAVSMAGSVGFVGLVIPHMTRFLVGSDYRWVIPCSAVLGGLLIECADMLSRVINPPFETPIGAITALIGVPFFLYLARNEGRGKM